MFLWCFELVKLIKQDCTIEFSVVSGPESLDGLVDCLLIPIVEEVHDLTGPIHHLDFDLDHFRFVGRDHMVHGPNVASWFDLDRVSGLYLHGYDRVGSWADFVGADGAHGVDCPSVLGQLEDFLPGLCDLESAVILD